MYVNDDSQMLEISSAKLFCIGMFHPWGRFVRRVVLMEDGCPTGHFDCEHCLHQYVNIQLLKGLSHEMDLAFDDMHGQF